MRSSSLPHDSLQRALQSSAGQISIRFDAPFRQTGKRRDTVKSGSGGATTGGSTAPPGRGAVGTAMGVSRRKGARNDGAGGDRQTRSAALLPQTAAQHTCQRQRRWAGPARSAGSSTTTEDRAPAPSPAEPQAQTCHEQRQMDAQMQRLPRRLSHLWCPYPSQHLPSPSLRRHLRGWMLEAAAV
jgi:hypothetical protein